MKTATIVIALCLCSRLTASAQGVHLGPGDTLAFGFNRVDGCLFTEGSPGAIADIFIGADPLQPGESMRVELFEDTLQDSPFASQVFSPATPIAGVVLSGTSSHWLDYQGLVQVSMLTGSTDILGAHFAVSPNPNTYCDTYVSVPEPKIALLMFIGGLACATLAWRRRANGTPCRASR